MNSEEIEKARQKWYDEHKNTMDSKLCQILSNYKYSRTPDNGWITNPIKYVATHSTVMTAICLELGDMGVDELRKELGF